MKPSSEKNRLHVQKIEIRMQTNAEALQRSSRVTRLITGGLPVPLYVVAFLIRTIDSGCQNTALDPSLSSLPEVTDSNSDLHLKN